MAQQAKIALLIIGDEILSGRTRDINTQVLATRLKAHGAALAEVRIVPDDEMAIVEAVRALASQYDFLVTSGGIGPTHDDITADCIAKAFHRGIDVRDDAKQILSTNYANGEADLNEARLRMARIPDDARLIANPISKAPGFQTENCFTLAGVPRIFETMLDDVLPYIPKGDARHSQSIRIDLPESSIATPLRAIACEYPALAFGSYPFEENGKYGANVVVSGFDESEIDKAIGALKTSFSL